MRRIEDALYYVYVDANRCNHGNWDRVIFRYYTPEIRTAVVAAIGGRRKIVSSPVQPNGSGAYVVITECPPLKSDDIRAIERDVGIPLKFIDGEQAARLVAVS